MTEGAKIIEIRVTVAKRGWKPRGRDRTSSKVRRQEGSKAKKENVVLRSSHVDVGSWAAILLKKKNF